MRRNSVFLAAVFGGGYLMEVLLDSGVEWLWDWYNYGVLMIINIWPCRSSGRTLSGSIVGTSSYLIKQCSLMYFIIEMHCNKTN